MMTQLAIYPQKLKRMKKMDTDADNRGRGDRKVWTYYIFIFI